MADAASHDEQVEDLMGSEIFMPAVKDGQFQGVENTSQRINNTSGQKPAESGGGKAVDNLRKSQNAYPSHSNIQYRRKPFRAVDPECLYNNSGKGDTPHQRA